MLEFEGQHGTETCTGPQPRSIMDAISQTLTEANPRISTGTPIINIILNIGGRRKRKKSLSEMVLEDDD